MKIVDFVRPELVVPDLRGTSKNAILEELASHLAAKVPGLDRAVLAAALAEREKLASTAIDQGVAIPHAKLQSLPSLVGLVGRSIAGVDFDSMDGKPTHLFFVLVAPASSTGVHLKALARISRLFRDPSFRQRLIGAPDAESLYRIIADEDAKQ